LLGLLAPVGFLAIVVIGLFPELWPEFIRPNNAHYTIELDKIQSPSNTADQLKATRRA
jgi:hypothetical protein